MSDLDQARALLDAAQRDLSALRGMYDAGIFADEIFGFHAQQVAEKALKSWLALLGQVYPRTHDLGRLLTLLQAHEIQAAQFEEVIELSPYAVQLRYEVYDFDSEPLNRKAAQQQVGALVEHVRRGLTG